MASVLEPLTNSGAKYLQFWWACSLINYNSITWSNFYLCAPFNVTYRMRARTEDILRNYGVSAKNGFLSEQPPVACLPDIYYAPWESIVHCLPTLITTSRIRSEIDALPLLDTSRLHTEAEWQRAYSILGFLTHAYIWGGDRPADVSV